MKIRMFSATINHHIGKNNTEPSARQILQDRILIRLKMGLERKSAVGTDHSNSVMITGKKNGVI